MNPLVFALGVGLILLTTLDVLWTTLWVDGHAGPLSSRYTDGLRRLFWRIVPDDNHRVLSLTGPVVLFINVLLWALLLWTSWVVLFSADRASLVQAHTGVPAGLVNRIYFTGYTIFTLGNGDYSPHGHVWEIATSLASLSGLFLLTLSVTYLLAIIEAVVAKRSFASQVWALGHSAEELVLHSWNGRSFAEVELQILSFTEQLNLVSEQHQAYPMLHYYHEADMPQSVSLGVAVFDDALTIWEFAVAPEVRPAPSALYSARESVREFLTTLRSAYIDPSKDAPPPLSLSLLSNAGIPLRDGDGLALGGDDLRERRRLIFGFLTDEHRQWPTPGRY